MHAPLPPSLDVAQLAQRLSRGEPLVLVDVREADEVARGTLPGARHIPLGEVVARADEVPRDRPVVVFCQRGFRSQRAIEALAPLGFGNLANLEGGYGAWPQDAPADGPG